METFCKLVIQLLLQLILEIFFAIATYTTVVNKAAELFVPWTHNLGIATLLTGKEFL